MTKTTQEEFRIILKAGFYMAQIHPSTDLKIQKFLNQLIELGNITFDELKTIQQDQKVDLWRISDGLVSSLAKKLFLLTLATVALADKKLKNDEKLMIEQMGVHLKVGKIKFSEITYDISEKMVIKLISEIKKNLAEPDDGVELEDPMNLDDEEEAKKKIKYDFFGG